MPNGNKNIEIPDFTNLPPESGDVHGDKEWMKELLPEDEHAEKQTKETKEKGGDIIGNAEEGMDPDVPGELENHMFEGPSTKDPDPGVLDPGENGNKGV